MWHMGDKRRRRRLRHYEERFVSARQCLQGDPNLTLWWFLDSAYQVETAPTPRQTSRPSTNMPPTRRTRDVTWGWPQLWSRCAQMGALTVLRQVVASGTVGGKFRDAPCSRNHLKRPSMAPAASSQPLDGETFGNCVCPHHAAGLHNVPMCELLPLPLNHALDDFENVAGGLSANPDSPAPSSGWGACPCQNDPQRCRQMDRWCSSDGVWLLPWRAS